MAEGGLKYTEQTLADDFLIGRYTGDHLKQRFQVYILAYRLHHTYIKCQNDHEIFAYSHRVVGWNQPPYKLSPDFSVTFRTNFGYGSVSYFATVLTYRDIEIVPFSKWITYRFVNQKELIKYSKWHSLDDESWYSAMSYVQQACNTFRRSETQFVKEYLTGECEKLISGLKGVLINSKFRFITSWYHFVERNEELTLSGDELLLFRAQKISGSLEFISSIKTLAHIIDIDSYIKQLETLNTQFLSTLITGIATLLAQLSILEKQLVPVLAIYEAIKEQRDRYVDELNAIRQSLADQGLSPELTADHFKLKFPEYSTFEKEFDYKQKQYFDLDANVVNKSRTLNDCITCRDIMNEYIADKNVG